MCKVSESREQPQLAGDVSPPMPKTHPKIKKIKKNTTQAAPPSLTSCESLAADRHGNGGEAVT